MGPRFIDRGKGRRTDGDSHRDSASMGPRFIDRGKILPLPPAAQLGLLQWGRGSSTAERRFASDRSTSRTHRFNGAAVHRPRKAWARSANPGSFPKLQWGRGSSTAERRPHQHGERLPDGFNGAAVHRPRKERSNRSRHQRPVASMGPRFIDRGKADQSCWRALPGSASMGPRFIDRGKTTV